MNNNNNTSNSSSKSDNVQQSDISKKLYKRIKTWSRLSGEKVWLPLKLIGRLDNDLLTDFAKEVYNKIRVICLDDNGNITLKKVSEIEEITICPSKPVKCKIKIDEQDAIEYNTIMTPTGYLNQIEEMIVKDFSEIAIDHINPIDKTLKEKEFKTLPTISDFVKDIKKKKNSPISKVEYDAAKEIQNIKFNMADLKDDLKAIIEDSPYLLTSASSNMKKSNVIDYKKFFIDKKEQKYYGYIGEAKDTNGEDMIIYQDLSKPNLLVETASSWKNKKLNEKNVVEISIENLYGITIRNQ